VRAEAIEGTAPLNPSFVVLMIARLLIVTTTNANLVKLFS